MFSRFQNTRYTTKLFISIVCISIVSIAVVAGNVIKMSLDSLNEFGAMAVANTHRTVFDTMMMYDKNVRLDIESDLKFFKKEIDGKGDVEMMSASLLKQTMTDERSGESITLDIPRLTIGATYINGSSDFVDYIQTILTTPATIFQLVDQKLLRVASTFEDASGKRNVDTYINSSSPIFQDIERGEIHLTKELILNNWYLTGYAPLYDWDDKLVGAISVARPLLDGQITELVSKVKIGEGFFHLYTRDGEVLFHPSLDKKSTIYDTIPNLKNDPKGLFEYTVNDKKRFAETKLLEQLGIYIAVDLSEMDIIGDLDTRMLRTTLIAGLLVVIAGVFLTLLLIRSINKPLKELADNSVKVGEGDYTVKFSSENQDAIGQLTNSLGTMVGKSKEMIEDIVSSASTLRDASGQLLNVSDQMVQNADSTNTIADQAAESAENVSSNMTTISSAMVESTSNLEVIAAAAEEMGSTIQEIARNSAEAATTTETAVASAENSQKAIRELGEAAHAIGKVTETITDISDQTNLLALNATIEAARAGEAGKGFAVVANEIKELAKQTAEATGEIKNAIQGIQSQTDETIVDIEKITSIITDVNEIVTSIVTAVEEQAATTSEIASNVNQASQGISEINSNIEVSSQLTGSMSEGVGQVKDKSLDVQKNSEEIQQSASTLSDLSSKLTDFVERFKI